MGTTRENVDRIGLFEKRRRGQAGINMDTYISVVLGQFFFNTPVRPLWLVPSGPHQGCKKTIVHKKSDSDTNITNREGRSPGDESKPT